MKNIFQKKSWFTGAVQILVDLPPVTLIESKNDRKLFTNCVKIKLRMDLTSEKSDLYKFKIALFDKGNPEEFLLFVKNLKMMLKVLGMLSASTKRKYLRTLLCGRALHQFATFHAQVGSTDTKHLNRIVLGLGTYLFPVN